MEKINSDRLTKSREGHSEINHQHNILEDLAELVSRCRDRH